MLPSLLLVLARPGPCRFGRPTIPSAARRGRSDSSFAMIVASGISSIKPAPNTGVGIRKIRFLRAASRLKSGWARTHPGASVRPAMVNRSWTPTSRVRSALNLNRASRTGPLSVMKEGTTFFAPAFVATAIWGLTDDVSVKTEVAWNSSFFVGHVNKPGHPDLARTLGHIRHGHQLENERPLHGELVPMRQGTPGAPRNVEMLSRHVAASLVLRDLH